MASRAFTGQADPAGPANEGPSPPSSPLRGAAAGPSLPTRGLRACRFKNRLVGEPQRSASQGIQTHKSLHLVSLSLLPCKMGRLALPHEAWGRQARLVLHAPCARLSREPGSAAAQRKPTQRTAPLHTMEGTGLRGTARSSPSRQWNRIGRRPRPARGSQPSSPQGRGTSWLGQPLPVPPAPDPQALGLYRPPACPPPPELPAFHNTFPAAGRWGLSKSWGPTLQALFPRGQALRVSPLPAGPPHCAHSRWLHRQHKGQPLPSCPEGQNPVPATAGLGCSSQGGGFTLSPPQTGQDEKKAGGGPAWGLPASQPSPGASQPRASVACPCRLAPSQPEGHPADIWPPESPAPLSLGPPCAAGVWSLGAWRRLRGVS